MTQMGRINGNLNLSRALGDLKYKGDKQRPRAEQIITAEPDVVTHTLDEQDEFMVLGAPTRWRLEPCAVIASLSRLRARTSERCSQPEPGDPTPWDSV